MRKRKKFRFLRHFYLWTRLSHFLGSPYKGTPIRVSPPRHFPANDHISSHIFFQGFPCWSTLWAISKSWRTKNYCGSKWYKGSIQCPREKNRYWPLIEYLSADSNIIILNKCSVSLKLTSCYIEWTEPNARLIKIGLCFSLTKLLEQ